MGDEIWRAAEPVTAAPAAPRSGSAPPPGTARCISSTSNGGRESTAPSEWVRSFHWPSSVSPLISKRVLAQIEAENDPWYYRREYLAEDIDDAEAVFPDSLIFAATAYEARRLSPEESARRPGRCRSGTDTARPSCPSRSARAGSA